MSRFTRTRRSSAFFAALVGLILAGVIAGPLSPAAAEGRSELTLTKTPSTTSVEPGETFSYELEVGCSAIDIGTGCTNARLVDPVPAEFAVIDVTVGSGLSAEEPTIDGNTVTVVFDSPLADPPGSVGLPASATGVVIVTVRARTDLPSEADGIPIDNTATLTASNQVAPATSTASVTPTVPLALAVTASKAFDPRVAELEPGATTTLTLGATNTSNATVDSLTITDPSDPALLSTPFDYLQVESIGAVAFPANADLVRIDAFDGDAWIAGATGATAELPPGVAPEDIVGLRCTFSGPAGIVTGGSGSVEVVLAQRDAVSTLTEPTTLQNTQTSTVVLGDQTADGTADDSYLILPNPVLVGATKTFVPDTVVAGDATLVTLGGSNETLTALDRLQIVEPTQPTPDPYANGFPAGVTMTGLGQGIVWPAGAESATMQYFYSDGTTQQLPATTVDTLPAADPSRTVVRFVATFTGSIAPGDAATIPFTVQTAPTLTEDSVVLTNTSTVTGTSPSGEVGRSDATAQLTVYATRLAVASGKVISPAQILSNPGEFVTVQLPSQLLQFPQSTTDATRIVVQDPPGNPPANTDWWNHFNATAITQTAVPAGASMTVRYWNGSAWLDLPGAVGVTGPQLFSMGIDPALQESIRGLRFIFTSVEGFPPGTTVQPNVTMTLRAELRDGSGPSAGTAASIENCAGVSAGDGPRSATAVTATPCPTVTLVPGDFPGSDDFLGKNWVGAKVVTARTDALVPVRLDWSTGGRANLASMVISDTADPASTAVADSVFNAFDLVGVPAITSSQDALLTFDQILRVELYDGTAWVPATNDPCPGACDGTFPGFTLTPAEQASTTGVRLMFAESPTRADRSGGDPTAPPTGSGVARSIGNDRGIVLTMRIRTDVRDPQSDPDPVIGTRPYNTAEPGAVENTASATGTSSIDGSVVSDTAADTIRILDVPLNVAVSKTWSGGPLGIPQAGTDPNVYPSGRVTVAATNTTAANVDRLRIDDPGVPGAAAPFESFTLTRFLTISVPAGATDTTVTLTNADGASTSYTRLQALLLPPSWLVDVVAVRVDHTGRIAAGATATVTFDARLRPTHRSDGTPVGLADSPIPNVSGAAVSDEGGAPGGTPVAAAAATIALASGSIGVDATKDFSPPVQTEPDRSPVTLTLTGTPSGTVRATSLTMTDEIGTFWNAFDVAGFATPLALSAPINRVRIDACVDRDWTDVSVGCEADGGTWVIGEPASANGANATPFPAGVTPNDVEGVRYTFTRADGSQFENPAAPIQSVPLAVQRRTELRSGGPVNSDLPGNAPAPGEPAAGAFTNIVSADVVGVLNDGGAPYRASDAASATARYEHLDTAVAVEKAPEGVQQPGSIIPYTLTVTNTGEIALADPVITDRLPVDADGPMLVFDPFADPTGPGPYSYTLSGAAPAPPSGLALPTDPTVVDAVVNGDASVITFTFPPGSVLEVGQSYVVTVELQFRPGLAAGVDVTNSFGVVGSRPFDACSGTLDPATAECRTDSTVTVQTAGALRGIKQVRADDTELGTLETVPGFACSPDAAGFFTGPCVPITKPGGSETWRLGLLNTGTVPMDRMVAVDKLPTPGDTGALAGLPRGSQFRPTFTGASSLAIAPDDAAMTVWYTTDAAPCVDDLITTGIACADGAWLPWDGTADASTVTGLKFVVEFPTPIQPADGIAIDVGTRTPAVSPTPGADTIAWNTVAVGGRVSIDGTPRATARSEGNKVGVALATGPLSVVKAVTGDGAAFAPGAFTGTVQCTSAGIAVPPRNVVLVPGEPTRVDDLPWGAECTVVENDAGQTSSTATVATVGRATEPVELITVTNRYELAGLIVSKTVDSSAVDASGAPVAYGPFIVDVGCTFLGGPVYADGFDADHPMGAELVDGQSASFLGLPAGAQCTVTETDPKGAGATTIDVETTAGAAPTVDGSSASVVITPDADVTPDIDTATTNTVEITNRFDSGGLRIVKTVSGAGADAFGSGPFRFQVGCELDDPSGSRSVWDGIVSVGGDDPLTATIDGIATGANCTVEEIGDGGASSSTVSPTTATIGTDETVTISAENVFLAGSLHIVKERVGAGVDRYGAGPFVVSLSCVRIVGVLPQLVDIPGGPTRQLDDATGFEASYDLLPDGALCLLTETDRAGATSSTILDASGGANPFVRITPGQTITLTAINTFAVGSIDVVKRFSGAPTPADTERSYAVSLACTVGDSVNRRAVVIPDGAERRLSAQTNLTARYDDLPAGAVCVLSETDPGTAASVTITPNDGDPARGTVTVADGVTSVLTVTNGFERPASLPSTGVDGAVLAALGAFGVLALTLGGALLSRRRSSPGACR